MMTADEYRAKAGELTRAADVALNYSMMLELEAVAREWIRLAELADWQDAMGSEPE